MIEPLRDMMLVEDIVTEEVTAGGIVLLDNSNAEQYKIKRVVKVGPGVIDVKPGDEVIVDRFSVINVRIKRQEFQLAVSGNVLGLWKESGIVSVET